MAVLDVAGFVADLKDHAVEHGFHVHDERHFVESYSLRQTWEVDLHPEEGCEGPVDLYLSLEIDPRVLLGFEDAVIEVGDDAEPDRHVPLPAELHVGAAAARRTVPTCSCSRPISPASAAATSRSTCRPPTRIPAATDAPERSLRIVAHQKVSLHRHPPRRRGAVRHARGVPRGEPLPARPGRRLARLNRVRPDGTGPDPPVRWRRGHAHRLQALREPDLRVR